MRPPLVLEIEGASPVAIPLAPTRMPKEPLVLPDVPPFLSPPCCPLHDLLHPLPVVAPLGFDVRRQVLAQHVGLHEAVAASRQEADRHDQPQASGLKLPGDAYAGDVRFLR